MNLIRFALRTLGRSPAATALIIVLLGLGVGAGTTIFSLFDAILLRHLPVDHPQQLVRMVQKLPKLPPRSYFPYTYYQALRNHASSFAFIFGETAEDIHLRLTDPQPAEQVIVTAVTPEFFSALGVKPFWGRVLTAADATQSTGLPPAVLSYRFWQKRFGGDSTKLAGQTLLVNGHRLAIVGVMPRQFNGTSIDTSPDLRIPVSAYPLVAGTRIELVSFQLAGRLKPGMSLAVAEQQCLALWNSTMRDYYLNVDKSSPADMAALLKRGMYLESLAHGTSILRDRLTDALHLLMAAVTVLVLIIGLNVAALLLASAASRRQEMAVRIAIGASPVQLTRQLAAESIVIALFATVAALCVQVLATPIALRLLPPVRNLYTVLVPISLQVGISGRSLFFLLFLTAVTTLVFTVSPVLAAVHTGVDGLLRSARSSATLRGRQLLISAQIALCTFLLICAGQLTHSFQKLAATPSGFDQDSIATFTCSLQDYKGIPAFLQQMKQRVSQLPGVVSVATSSIGVMRGHGRFSSVTLAGKQVGQSEFMGANSNDVSPGYFTTMGMRVIAGRDLAASDLQISGQTKSAVVNEEFVRRFLAHENPLGKRFGSAMEGRVAKPDYQIVGVVSNARYRTIQEPVRPTYYTLQTDFEDFVLNVRTSPPAETIIGPVRQAAASVAPDVPFQEVNTLAREVAETTAPERTTAVLSSLFALVAAILAGVGTYGLLAFTLSLRRSEIGIRMALGAGPTDIMRLIARQTVGITLAGLLLGLAAALLAGPVLRSLIYGLPENDPASFAAAALLVVSMAILASIAPVLNAARIQPAEALRQRS